MHPPPLWTTRFGASCRSGPHRTLYMMDVRMACRRQRVSTPPVDRMADRMEDRWEQWAATWTCTMNTRCFLRRRWRPPPAPRKRWTRRYLADAKRGPRHPRTHRANPRTGHGRRQASQGPPLTGSPPAFVRAPTGSCIWRTSGRLLDATGQPRHPWTACPIEWRTAGISVRGMDVTTNTRSS